MLRAVNINETYACVEKAKDELIACSLQMTEASRWARHRLGLLGLLKYWHLRKAKQHLGAAKQHLVESKAQVTTLANPAIGPDKARMAADVVLDGAFDFVIEMRISEEVDTALLEVNQFLEDVGAVLAKLRNAGAKPTFAAAAS
jgi:hypothetical protein